MIFPFEITRHFKLPDSEFGKYKSDYIIDTIYDYLTNEDFKWIKKENNKIEFAGNKYRAYFKRGLTTHCIDRGIVTINDSNNSRRIVYIFQIRNHLLIYLGLAFSFLLIFGVATASAIIGFVAFGFVIIAAFLNWLIILLLNPSTIYKALKKMRMLSEKA